MRQRVSIARALIHQPSILLMDEPFGALDAITRTQIRHDLELLWMETRKTVLFITHSIEEAIGLSDRVLVMSPNPGRIVDEIAIDLPRPRPARPGRGRELQRLRRAHPPRLSAHGRHQVLTVRTLVTGGAGFLGQAFAVARAARGTPGDDRRSRRRGRRPMRCRPMCQRWRQRWRRPVPKSSCTSRLC